LPKVFASDQIAGPFQQESKHLKRLFLEADAHAALA
jgi:hypothetical protein